MKLFDRVVRVDFENRTTGEKFTIENTSRSNEGVKISFQVEKQISMEPNVAYIEIYNLNNNTREKINFKQDVFNNNFGPKIDLYAGYRGADKKIFSGLVVYANSPKDDGTTFVTRIVARNVFYELMAKKINKTASRNEPRYSFILGLMNSIGANVSSRSSRELREALKDETGADSKFKTSTVFLGTANEIINQINGTLTGRMEIYFDDIGVNFNPLGVPIDEPEIVYDQYSGLIGIPEITETGANFKVLLDPNIKVNSRIRVKSDVLSSIKPDGKYVTKKVIHTGSSRADDVFETRIEAIYEEYKQLLSA